MSRFINSGLYDALNYSHSSAISFGIFQHCGFAHPLCGFHWEMSNHNVNHGGISVDSRAVVHEDCTHLRSKQFNDSPNTRILPSLVVHILWEIFLDFLFFTAKEELAGIIRAHILLDSEEEI